MLTAVVWWAATYIRAFQGIEHRETEGAHQQNQRPFPDQNLPVHEELVVESHAEERNRQRPARKVKAMGGDLPDSQPTGYCIVAPH